MVMEFDRSGTFRGQITEYSVSEYDSGALAIHLQVAVEDYFNPETRQWDDWREYEVVGDGNIFIGKKSGEVNEKAFTSLVEHAGWDGSLKSVDEKMWQPTPIQFTVEADEYKNQIRYRLGFINAYNSVPGNATSVTSSRVAELESKFGAKFRALASTVKRSSSKPPTSGPAAPPPRKTPEAAPPAQQEEPVAADELPF